MREREKREDGCQAMFFGRGGGGGGGWKRIFLGGILARGSLSNGHPKPALNTTYPP